MEASLMNQKRCHMRSHDSPLAPFRLPSRAREEGASCVTCCVTGLTGHFTRTIAGELASVAEVLLNLADRRMSFIKAAASGCVDHGW